jgi:hypothetical protein
MAIDQLTQDIFGNTGFDFFYSLEFEALRELVRRLVETELDFEREVERLRAWQSELDAENPDLDEQFSLERLQGLLGNQVVMAKIFTFYRSILREQRKARRSK